VQPGHDDLDPGDLLLGVGVDRHAAPVVDHLQGRVLIEKYIDSAGEPGNGFVDRVVDDLLGQVVRPGRIGVHPRPPSHRFEAPQDLEIGGVVVVRTSHPGSTSCCFL